MSYATYPNTVSTRFAGAEEIPTGWEARRLKFAVTYNDEALPETTDPDSEIAYVDISSVDLVEGIKKVEQLTFEEAPSRARRIVKDGDTIISTVRTYLKAIAAIEDPPENMIVSTGFAVIRPLEFVYRRYLGYALQGVGFVDRVVANSTGVSYPAINPSTLVTIAITYPDEFDEQKQIADFLDWKTGQIDALIAKKQQLIEKLQEQRSAVITQAVTKGLNPDAPMRDSGIPWLGEVPEGWDARRFKFLTREGVSGPYGSSLTKSMYTNEGYRVYGQQQVIPDDYSVGDYYIDAEKFAEMERYSVRPRDFLVTVMGTIGEVSVVPEEIEPGIINPRLVLYRLQKNEVLPEFAQAVFRSAMGRSQLDSTSKGTTMEGLNMELVEGIVITVPPIDEQRTILEYLAAKTDIIDRLIVATQRAIVTLTEYRTALITAATTGKIDVRKVKIPKSAA
ncbi:MAG: restriction endonuclease subunit S [Verrucomicrobiota bacterium]